MGSDYRNTSPHTPLLKRFIPLLSSFSHVYSSHSIVGILKRLIPLLSSFSHVYSSHSIVGILTPNLTRHHPYPYSSNSYCSIFTLFVSFFIFSFHMLCRVACAPFSHHLWLGDLYIKASVASCRINQEVFSPSLCLSLSLRSSLCSSPCHRLTPGNWLKSTFQSKSID